MGRKSSRAASSLFILTLWSIWKERNNKIFNRLHRPAPSLISAIKAEASLWGLVDTSGLGALVSRSDDVP
ncbi:hypothetical protein BRADI_1g52116v3 [Brachypodium distachyon]|uniref:Uncharacterized protein n=1 Tax=Brachypodium distachyon TaxID=15368 RepID=A0A2K2DR14_BRADI|nr:hypothetical protein BRADI_1g52116v3 [Brachypodium distachyon]